MVASVKSGLAGARGAVIICFAACLLLMSWFAPGMFTPRNVGNLFSNLLPLLVLTTGEMLVLIGGGIDLSVTSIMAVASVLGAKMMNGGNGWLAGSPWAAPSAVVAMLLACAALGALNGLAVTRLEMPPFIVSLTTMMLFSGAAVWATKSRNIDRLPAAFCRIGGAPYPLLIAAALVLSTHALLRRSVWGRWLYAVGMNARTSLVSGVPVQAITVAAYAASGSFAAVAAVLYTARLETGSPVLGQRVFLDVIAAAVIGGASLSGGRGGIPGILGGVLFVAALDNALNLVGFSFSVVLMAKGAVILAAAALDTARSRAWGAART
jgi:ribose/xylose/arabinose/galactoside ABC-type transport system permease subunit